MKLSKFKPAVQYVHDLRRWARQTRYAQSWLNLTPPKDNPTLSIVIPCYNASRWILTLVHSIQAQGIDDLEILVIDDNSTDQSATILKYLALLDRRIRVIPGEGRGPGAARNLGVSLAKGNYLAFADADDLVLPGAYKAMLASITETGSDFVFGGYVRHRNSSVSRPQIVERTHQRTIKRVNAQSFPQAFEEPVLWNKVFKKSFWDRHIGDMPTELNYEDQLPVLKAIINATSFDVLKEDVYSWRLSEEGQSRSSAKSSSKDLRDRTEITQIMWQEALQSGAPRELAAFMLERFISRDIPLYAVNAPRKPHGDSFRESLRIFANLLFEWTHDFPEIWNNLPFARRSLIWVLANGSDSDLDEELGLRLETNSGYAFTSSGAPAPECLPRVKGLPAELLRARKVDLPTRAKIQSLQWLDANTCRLRIRAFMAGVAPDEVNLNVFILEASEVDSDTPDPNITDGVSPVPIEQVIDTRNDAEVRDPWHNRQANSFEFTVSLDKLDKVSFAVKCDWYGFTTISYLRASTDPSTNIPSPIGQNSRWTVTPKRGIGGKRFELHRQTADENSLVLANYMVSASRITTFAHPADAPSIISKSTTRMKPLGYQRLLGWAKTAPLMHNHRPLIFDVLHVQEANSVERLIIEHDIFGNAMVNFKATRVVIDEASLHGSRLVISGRSSSSYLKPTLWLSSSSSVLKASTTWRGQQFTAEFALTSLRAKSYFLRWSHLPNNRFTKAAVEPGRLAANTFIEGTVRSVLVEPRINGTTAFFILPPRDIAYNTSWEIYRGIPKQSQPLLRGIFFESFSGKNAADNPGAICEYLIHQIGQIPLWVSVRDEQTKVPDGAIPVITGSDDWYDKLTRSKIIIGNDNFPLWFRKREGQYWLQTWHGTPIKRLLFDAHPNFVGLSYRRLMRRQATDWDLLLAQTTRAGKLIGGSALYKGEVMVGEYPRNIKLARGLNDVEGLKRKLDIPLDKPVILWAPTWRYSANGIPFPAALIARKNKAVVLVRSHHMSSITMQGPGVINVSDYPHVEELMAVSDLLISDYSSVLFDFQLTKKPAIIYAPDLKRYRDEERGFYGDWPSDSTHPYAENTKELLSTIELVLENPISRDSELTAQRVESQVENTLERILSWVRAHLEQ